MHRICHYINKDIFHTKCLVPLIQFITTFDCTEFSEFLNLDVKHCSLLLQFLYLLERIDQTLQVQMSRNLNKKSFKILIFMNKKSYSVSLLGV